MSDQVPGVGVVGCGYWGKNLVRNFSELGALRAIFDADQTCLTEMARNYAAPVIRSFAEMLSMTEIQGVVIAAPAAQHFQLTKTALLAGKHVFVEKPIALHVEQGEELVDIARKQNSVLMVGHLLLYHPAVLELRRLIRAGDLGRIQYIYSSRLNWGKLRTEENILWSFAPHDISTILFLLDEEPIRIGAHGGQYLNPKNTDITLSTFEFASGVKAHIFVSWLHPFKEQKLVIVGGRKLAVFDDTEKERKLTLYPHRIDWVDRIPVAQKVDGQVIPVDSEEPLRLECQHFLECIRDGKKSRTDGESAVQVLRILEACEKSLYESSQLAAPKPQPPQYMIHPTAVVDEPCKIGDGTKIWHFSHIMEKTNIGRNCIIGQNVHVASGVKIGNNVKIQNNVSVYTGVELEDDVFCGPSMVFTNVINPRSHISRKDEYMPTLIKRGATLGANSTVVCGVNIGAYAFVAAGAVVTRDVADYALVMGVPAKQVGWMCRCGHRLEISETRLTCSACGENYTLGDGRLERRAYVHQHQQN